MRHGTIAMATHPTAGESQRLGIHREDVPPSRLDRVGAGRQPVGGATDADSTGGPRLRAFAVAPADRSDTSTRVSETARQARRGFGNLAYGGLYGPVPRGAVSAVSLSRVGASGGQAAWPVVCPAVIPVQGTGAGGAVGVPAGGSNRSRLVAERLSSPLVLGVGLLVVVPA